MTAEQRRATPRIDYRPFIIADADTGHGGDPHVRNLIQRFVEAGVPGYHIEDQKPGCKKCGHSAIINVLITPEVEIKKKRLKKTGDRKHRKISQNDILDIKNFLDNFDGNFKKIFHKHK